MLPIETIITFALASCLLCLAPGPDNIFVLAQSALHGRKSGLMVTSGLCTGLIVHTTAVAIGIAAIFRSSILAFNLLKFIGVGYLLYLAWKSFRAKDSSLDSRNSIRDSRLYRRGVIMNVTNPKVSIFFLAFLPQFVSPDNGMVTLQILSLGFIFIISTFIVFGFIALMAGSLGEFFRRYPSSQSIMNKIAGTVFVGLAVKLLVSTKQ